MKLNDQVMRKASLMVVASALAAFGATILMNASTWLDVGKALVALAFAGTVFAIREWAKRWDETVVIRGEKPPEYHYTTDDIAEE